MGSEDLNENEIIIHAVRLCLTSLKTTHRDSRRRIQTTNDAS